MPVIRSFTVGIPGNILKESKRTQNYLRELTALKDEFLAGGLRVETTRISVSPREPTNEGEFERVCEKTRQIAIMVENAAIDYFSAPIWVQNAVFQPAMAALIREIPTLFLNLPVIDQDHIDDAAVRLAAAMIEDLAREDPMYNLRFCALASVPPNVPFFPAAYHDPHRTYPVLTIALEVADIVVSAAREAMNSEDPFEVILERSYVEFHSQIVNVIKGSELTLAKGFGGVDLSPAPFPEPERSIAAAIEILGGGPLGGISTTPAVATITWALSKLVPSIGGPGFHGVMLPVMEDAVLAKRVSEGRVNIGQLLLYSTVCGTGLDTIPLAGNVSPIDLEHLIRNVGWLGLRHNKPLTARLMPIKDHEIGDPVDLGFEYFAPSTIMGPE